MVTILLVEDETQLRDILSECLTREGYQVLTAPDGLAAKKILVTAKIELVISDVRMPNMNGVDLLKFAKSLPESPKVVMLSGFSDFTRDQLIEMGAVAYLEKPFTIEQLLAVVQGLVVRPSIDASTEQT